MQLILAIDADRQQAELLAAVVGTRLAAELVQASSAGEALQELGDRVPDVILTSPLLSPFDDGVLAEYLRELGPAAAHVQTIRIPVLGSPKPSARGRFSFGRKRRAQAAPDGCDPKVFADEIAAYLARAAEERQAIVDTGHRPDPDGPQELASEPPTYVPAYGPDPAPGDVDDVQHALNDVGEHLPTAIAAEWTRQDDWSAREEVPASLPPPVVQRTHDAVTDPEASAIEAPYEPVAAERHDPAGPSWEPVSYEAPLAGAQAYHPVAELGSDPVADVRHTLVENEAAPERPYESAVLTGREPIVEYAGGPPVDVELAAEARPEIMHGTAGPTRLVPDVPDEELFVLDAAPLAADAASTLTLLEADPIPEALPSPSDEPYVLLCSDEGVALPPEMLAYGATTPDECVPLVEKPAANDSACEPADLPGTAPDPTADMERPTAVAMSDTRPASVDATETQVQAAPPPRRTPAFEAALAAIRKAWGKPRRSEARVPAAPLELEEAAATPALSDEPRTPPPAESEIDVRGGSEIDLTCDVNALEDRPPIEAIDADAGVSADVVARDAETVPPEIDRRADDQSAAPAFHDLESDLAAAAPPQVLREPAAEIQALVPEVQPRERIKPAKARKTAKKRPEAGPPAKSRTPAPRPAEDEWGLFDPNRCGFAALVEKLNEVTDEDDPKAKKTTVRVISYR